MTEPSEAAFGIVLWTSDVASLTSFLASVGRLEVEDLHPGFATLRANGSRIMVHADESYRGHPWYIALHHEGAARGIGAELRLRVPDVVASFNNAVALGGVVVQAPYDDGGVRECQVMAPDGFLLALWQPVA